MLNITSIPASRVPITDPVTGIPTREWYMYFYNIFSLLGGGGSATSIEDILKAPPNYIPDVLALLQNLEQGPPYEPIPDLDTIYQQAQLSSECCNTSAIAQLAKQVQALALASANQANTAELAKQVQALALSPVQPEVQALAYGSFRRDDTKAIGAINTAEAVQFQVAETQKGVEWKSGTPSRIYVYSPGVYNIQFSAQMTKPSASVHYAYLWPAINGTDVADSGSRVAFQGSNSDLVAAWNWFLTLKSGDYVELKWAADDANITMIKYASTAFSPAIPAVIFTVNKVSL